ncbi:MAG: cytochrome c1 [Steroidobacteraceae bacterium]
MRIDRGLVLALALSLAPPVMAAGGGSYPDAGTDIHDTPSLQRGARNFANYCMGCHSAEYMRWNRLAADLGISDQVLEENLMLAGGKPHDVILSAMPAAQAAEWFGKAPPDLSLIARSRGVDYLSAFLHGFYADPSRPTGVNNTVLANTAMPHVLVGLQGLQEAEYELVTRADGATEQRLVGFKLDAPGELTPAEYDGFVRDTVNFLDYMGEPVKAKRERLGVWVVLFLLVLFLLAWLQKKEYWKDVR